MKAEEIEIDALPGLPSEPLPPGERILWQGRPQWRSLARHAFKIRWLAFYFAVFLGARMVSLVTDGLGLEGVLQLLVMTLLFAIGLGVCALLAWSQARSTIYTITTARVVMHVGAAFSVTWNLPFRQLAAADLVERDEGDGDLVLRLAPPNRLAWIHLWPHALPGRRWQASPTFRAIAKPQEVAALLGEAVRAWAAQQEPNPGLFVDGARGQTPEVVAPAPALGRPIAVARLASEGTP